MYRLSRLLLVFAVVAAFYCAIAITLIAWPWPVVALVVFIVLKTAQRGYGKLTAYGTAKWASAADLSGVMGREGLIIGRLMGGARESVMSWVLAALNPRWPSKLVCAGLIDAMRKPEGRVVRLPKVVHTAVFAPTGVGKGVSFVIPHLLTCPDSCVVIDFKGELYRETAEHRRAMGHKVVALCPFPVEIRPGEFIQSDTFNPLDFIDARNPLAVDECRALAEALVIRTGEEKEPHWNDSAEMWIATMLAGTVAYGERSDRSLQTIRGLLTDPKQTEGAIELFSKSDAWQGVLARMADQLKHFKDKELGSTLTTVNRHLRFADTPAIIANTTTSSFDPAELLTGKMTVYLILPPEHMRAQSALLRMWVGAMLRAVVKGGLKNKNKTHFVLDEAASLGRLECLEDAVDKLRAYGVRLQFYYQSLGQLKASWREGKDQTLLSNCSKIFFGCQDIESCEYISKSLGEGTIAVTSGSRSWNKGRNNPDIVIGNQTGSSSYGSSGTESWQQHGRALLKPEEVMQLPERVAITFTPGAPPIKTWLLRFYEKGWSKGLAPAALSPFKAFMLSAVLAAVFGLLAVGLTGAVQDMARAEQQTFQPFVPPEQFNPLMPQQFQPFPSQ